MHVNLIWKAPDIVNRLLSLMCCVFSCFNSLHAAWPTYSGYRPRLLLRQYSEHPYHADPLEVPSYVLSCHAMPCQSMSCPLILSHLISFSILSFYVVLLHLIPSHYVNILASQIVSCCDEGDTLLTVIDLTLCFYFHVSETAPELDYVTAYIGCLSSDRLDGLYTTVGTDTTRHVHRLLHCTVLYFILTSPRRSSTTSSS